MISSPLCEIVRPRGSDSRDRSNAKLGQERAHLERDQNGYSFIIIYKNCDCLSLFIVLLFFFFSVKLKRTFE